MTDYFEDFLGACKKVGGGRGWILVRYFEYLICLNNFDISTSRSEFVGSFPATGESFFLSYHHGVDWNIIFQLGILKYDRSTRLENGTFRTGGAFFCQ